MIRNLVPNPLVSKHIVAVSMLIWAGDHKVPMTLLVSLGVAL